MELKRPSHPVSERVFVVAVVPKTRIIDIPSKTPSPLSSKSRTSNRGAIFYFPQRRNWMELVWIAGLWSVGVWSRCGRRDRGGLWLSLSQHEYVCSSPGGKFYFKFNLMVAGGVWMGLVAAEALYFGAVGGCWRCCLPYSMCVGRAIYFAAFHNSFGLGRCRCRCREGGGIQHLNSYFFFYSPRSFLFFLFLRVWPGEKLALNMQIQQICSVNTELCFIFIFDLNYDWEVEKTITPTTATTRGTLKFLIYFRISWNLHIGLWIFFFSTELKE